MAPILTVAHRNCLTEQKGPAAVAEWMLKQQVLITDTTMRDGHQSPLATRLRSNRYYIKVRQVVAICCNCFSIECWGRDV